MGPQIPYPPSLPVNRFTDTCEYITFPQLRWRAVKILTRQECIPVGCVPPTRYHTGSLCPGGSNRDPLGKEPPGQRLPPWTETSPGQKPPGQRPPRQRPPMDRDLQWTETSLDRHPSPPREQNHRQV